MEKQVDLTGKKVGKEEQKDDDREDLAILKSALQKAVRRAEIEKAMYFALRLAEKNWWTAWRRLTVISVEDVGQPLEIVAVDTLFKQFMAFKRQQGKDEQGLSWDMKRCVVAAARMLAESWKDRRNDEFLELLDAVDKHGKDFPELQEWRDEVSTVPDEALDVHTMTGRKMHRGNLHWLEVSSQTELRTVDYEIWREWFEELMRKVYGARAGSS